MSTKATLDDFNQWCKSLTFGNEADRSKLRWSAALALVESATRTDVACMLAALYSNKKPLPADFDRLIGRFKENDPAFSSTNEHEIEVLLGSCLAILAQSDSNLGNYCAIMIEVTEFDGQRKHELDFDLLALAKNAIKERALTTRSRPKVGSIEKKIAPLVIESIIKPYTDKPDADGLKQSLTLFINRWNEAETALNERTHSFARTVSAYLAMQDEELQVLWWLFGGVSWDLKKPFDQIAEKFRPIVLGKEMADITHLYPGLFNVVPILSRAGISNDKFLLAEIINGCDREWLRTLSINSTDHYSPLLFPIHTAIVRRLETMSDTDWIGGWYTISELAQGAVLSSCNVANLFYLERLALKSEAKNE